MQESHCVYCRVDIIKTDVPGSLWVHVSDLYGTYRWCRQLQATPGDKIVGEPKPSLGERLRRANEPRQTRLGRLTKE